MFIFFIGGHHHIPFQLHFEHPQCKVSLGLNLFISEMGIILLVLPALTALPGAPHTWQPLEFFPEETEQASWAFDRGWGSKTKGNRPEISSLTIGETKLTLGSCVE